MVRSSVAYADRRTASARSCASGDFLILLLVASPNADLCDGGSSAFGLCLLAALSKDVKCSFCSSNLDACAESWLSNANDGSFGVEAAEARGSATFSIADEGAAFSPPGIHDAADGLLRNSKPSSSAIASS